MSVAYTAVGWNRQKRIYDLAVMVVLLLGLAAFGAAIAIAHPATTAETFILRFTAMSALVLLHVILAIGPLARLDTRFLPLLYNRRHLGVTMFVLAAIHGVFAIVQFHALGDSNPLVSTITAYASDYTTWLEHPKLLSRFPFESLGAAALLIFLVMAATSHDFWLKNLGPSFWKLMHMAVYIAYALVIGHVVLGALQSERSPLYPVLLTAGCAVICGLHVAAWWRERSVDVRHTQTVQDGYELVGRADEMPEGVGRVVVASGSRIALFKHKGRLFAISNTCRHQGGPLGEGRVVYDCLTCPWHGYQYRLEDGCSPPPFTEIVPTYPVRVIDGSIYVRPQMLPLQTKSEGEACLDDCASEVASETQDGFYIGWLDKSAAPQAVHTRRVVIALAVLVPFMMGLIAWQQNPVDEGTFEFGNVREFTGTLHMAPVPMLSVEPSSSSRGSSPPGEAASPAVNYLLVGPGKSGISGQLLSTHDGARVRFLGTLLFRRNMRMIEVAQPESIAVLEPAASHDTETRNVSLGSVSFAGELVDTKCYTGVMRPATGKVHKGCAVRCLSGGVPPGLLLRDESGDAVVILLADEAGKPLKINPEWAADIIRAEGDLELHGNLPVLKVRETEHLLRSEEVTGQP